MRESKVLRTQFEAAGLNLTELQAARPSCRMTAARGDSPAHSQTDTAPRVVGVATGVIAEK